MVSCRPSGPVTCKANMAQHGAHSLTIKASHEAGEYVAFVRRSPRRSGHLIYVKACQALPLPKKLASESVP